MQAILANLREIEQGEIEVLIFGDDAIMNDAPEAWPIVDFLICFHTHNFPLEKAIEYVRLRNPVCINDVTTQADLLSRVYVYETLRENGIPCPDFTIVDHGKATVLDCEDWMEIDGRRLKKVPLYFLLVFKQ